jgi:hypothetical protein
VQKSVAETERVVAARTGVTRSAVKSAAATARNRAATTRTVAKGAVTSARKTAGKAVEAVEATTEKVGEEPSAG